jgi:hypothetical protein
MCNRDHIQTPAGTFGHGIMLALVGSSCRCIQLATVGAHVVTRTVDRPVRTRGRSMA